MLKVKIEPVVGFGKTAEWVILTLQSYDLASKQASVRADIRQTLPSNNPAEIITGQVLMSEHVRLTPEETADWGTDDMVLVDLVLSKLGLTRDADWQDTVPTPPVEGSGPESTDEPAPEEGE